MKFIFNNMVRDTKCEYHRSVKDPVVLHHPTRKSVGYFGVIRLRDGNLVYKRESNSFNVETFWKFMKKLTVLQPRPESNRTSLETKQTIGNS